MNDSTPIIEKDCVVSFEGKEFEAGGAFISDSHLVAYPAENGILKDWHGKQIGVYSILSSRRAVFFGRESWQGSKYYYMRAKVNGKLYSLRGFGIGMFAKGKRIKSKLNQNNS